MKMTLGLLWLNRYTSSRPVFLRPLRYIKKIITLKDRNVTVTISVLIMPLCCMHRPVRFIHYLRHWMLMPKYTLVTVAAVCGWMCKTRYWKPVNRYWHAVRCYGLLFLQLLAVKIGKIMLLMWLPMMRASLILSQMNAGMDLRDITKISIWLIRANYCWRRGNWCQYWPIYFVWYSGGYFGDFPAWKWNCARKMWS